MAKLISTWDELRECTSETHILEIKDCNGWVLPKNDPDENSFQGKYYLSTHTFYGDTYQKSTGILQKCGFDVQLANWDGDTEVYTEEDKKAEAGKANHKTPYCNTCIVGRKTPEYCETCDR